MEFVFGLADIQTLAVECAAGSRHEGKRSTEGDYFMLLGEFSGYSREELKAKAGKYFAGKKSDVLFVSAPRKYPNPVHRSIRHSA